jgi:anti-anti-sigma factor
MHGEQHDFHIQNEQFCQPSSNNHCLPNALCALQTAGWMIMAINVKIDDSSARISMAGRFGFDGHQNFKNAYSALLDNAAIHEIEIELSKVNYMDCSALGMLLLLSERAKAANKKVTLHNPSPTSAQLLSVANFGKVFDIKHQTPFNQAATQKNPLYL